MSDPYPEEKLMVKDEVERIYKQEMGLVYPKHYYLRESHPHMIFIPNK